MPQISCLDQSYSGTARKTQACTVFESFRNNFAKFEQKISFWSHNFLIQKADSKVKRWKFFK